MQCGNCMCAASLVSPRADRQLSVTTRSRADACACAAHARVQDACARQLLSTSTVLPSANVPTLDAAETEPTDALVVDLPGAEAFFLPVKPIVAAGRAHGGSFGERAGSASGRPSEIWALRGSREAALSKTCCRFPPAARPADRPRGVLRLRMCCARRGRSGSKLVRPHACMRVAASEAPTPQRNLHRKMAEAAAGVEHDITLLREGIKRIGKPGANAGEYVATFGALFKDEVLEQQLESLVGSLKAMKKRKLVNFEGQMLLQGAHDHVEVTLFAE